MVLPELVLATTFLVKQWYWQYFLSYMLLLPLLRPS